MAVICTIRMENEYKISKAALGESKEEAREAAVKAILMGIAESERRHEDEYTSLGLQRLTLEFFET